MLIPLLDWSLPLGEGGGWLNRILLPLGLQPCHAQILDGA